MTDTNRTFKNANEAFDYLHDALMTALKQV